MLSCFCFFATTDGDHQYYPVYEPSVEELQARLKAAEGEPVEKHYDGNAEGACFPLPLPLRPIQT